ncbi:MAG: ATP-binding protein [Pseudomonadota bacterium]
MLERFRNWPWLTLQIIVANVAVILGLATVWYLVFMQQSSVYSDRLMHTFNIQPGQLHAMYVDDVERQLWGTVVIGIVIAIVAAVGLAWLIVRPLRTLARTTERLQHGDYGVRSPINSGEVGLLAENVNALAAALEQEERRRAQYMADLSHELRTPITNLRGYTEGLEDGVVQPDEHFFKLMSSELSHLTALTRTIDTLQLESRLREGDDTISVVEQLNDAVARWDGRFAKRALQLELRLPDGAGACHVAVPSNSLRQIVDNLMSNMVRYAPPTDACVIDVERDKRDNTVSLAFCNYAPDIDDKALPFLFDRFYRVSASRTREPDEHASGLGLAIVKQLCMAAGGRVRASIDDLRLVITVELPISPAAPLTAGAQGFHSPSIKRLAASA